MLGQRALVGNPLACQWVGRVTGGVVLACTWRLSAAQLDVQSAYIDGFDTQRIQLCRSLITRANEALVPAIGFGLLLHERQFFLQLGSALGIAVLGSVLNGVYRADLAPHLSGAPAAAAEAATSSIAVAQEMATKLPGRGAELAAAADQAFMSGVSEAFAVGAVALALGSVFVWWRAPRKGTNPGT